MKWLGMILGLTLVAGCSRAPKQMAPPAPEVAVVAVAPQPVTLTTELPGRTAAFLMAEIRPQVNGLIQQRLFTEGADVKAGDVLYQIDAAPFQAVFDKAAANAQTLRLRVNRYKEAVSAKAVSQQTYDDAVAALKAAEADLETARINLSYTKITAPVAGRIGKSSVTDGAIVTAYQPVPLATIQQLDPVYVDVPQSTTELLRLQRRLANGGLNRDGAQQNKVQLILEDGTNYPHEGTLEFRDVTVNPATATVIVRMVFPNPDGVLLPGMFVRAVVKEGVNERAMLVPQNAVSRDPKGTPLAMVVNAQGVAELRVLQTDRAIGNQWLVTGGLAPGDQVIVEGLQKIRPGAPVKIAVPAPATK